ncbi:hypothetical protein NUW54_g9172 [Trametes sanguinea]|uniref:Uncharacterized protein n=1 Tax=Trametes sanguinea TaxID=158606 RepID=A0ACC1P9Q6_9APHY|nr:hypothetical protein NUW54_g9172 [Trametes sanguinea]
MGSGTGRRRGSIEEGADGTGEYMDIGWEKGQRRGGDGIRTNVRYQHAGERPQGRKPGRTGRRPARNGRAKTSRDITVTSNPGQQGTYTYKAGGRDQIDQEQRQLRDTRHRLQAIMQDMQILADALEEQAETFALDQRNFGAQQAKVLRDQKSWSGRSAIERLFWTIDSSIELVSRSTDWVARD